MASVSKTSDSELDELQRILDDEVPRLRRLAAPLDYSAFKEKAYS